jgi:hypothetical protein
MRTIIDLDPHAYVIAANRARQRKQSLGKVISDLIIAESPASAEDLAIEISPLTGLVVFRSPRPMSSADVQELLKED